MAAQLIPEYPNPIVKMKNVNEVMMFDRMIISNLLCNTLYSTNDIFHRFFNRYPFLGEYFVAIRVYLRIDLMLNRSFILSESIAINKIWLFIAVTKSITVRQQVETNYLVIAKCKVIRCQTSFDLFKVKNDIKVV